MKRKDVNIDIHLLAAAFISKQLARLMPHLQGACDAEDTEDVHQTRVTCRRMRAALHLFGECFGKKQSREWDKQLKRLLKSFGRARDLDVQIDFLKGVLDGLAKEDANVHSGIERMLLRWQQQRREVQPMILRAIKLIHKSSALTNIHLQMERVRFVHRASPKPLNDNVVCKYAYDHIRVRVRDIVVRLDSLKDPEDIEGHHDLRIAAKKLRYAMEIFDGALEGKLKSAIKKVKEVQTLFGEMHDCDVWSTNIDDFIRQEEERTREFYGHVAPFGRILPGLMFLRKERSDHRGDVYRKACALLDQLQEEHFWDTFPQVLICEQGGPDTEETGVQADDDGGIPQSTL